MSKPGQIGLQVGHLQELPAELHAETRTEQALTETHPGHESITTGAQRFEEVATALRTSGADLAVLVTAWAALPEPAQRAIVALAGAFQSPRHATRDGR